MTRRYRSLTFWVRRLSRAISFVTFDPLEKLAVVVGLIKKPQKTILWNKHPKRGPIVPHAAPGAQPGYAMPSPSFQLTDLSSDRPGVATNTQETPAMAHSLFPPAIATRARNESDASHNPLSPYTMVRTSDESSRPLIQRPTGVYHHPEEPERRGSGEPRVSFEDTFLHGSPPEQREWLAPGTTVHSRQGYRRANSDPGLPPHDGVVRSQDGLGIELDDTDLERGNG